MLIGLNVISSSCISKLIGCKFTSFLSCHFLSMPLFSLWLKACCFYLAYMCEEALVSKDPSATIVASVHSTAATVVGSLNATEFRQSGTQPQSFLLLLSHKMDLALPVIHSSPWHYMAAKRFIIITVLATITFVLASFPDVLYSIGTNLKRNWGCPMAVPIKYKLGWEAK